VRVVRHRSCGPSIVSGRARARGGRLNIARCVRIWWADELIERDHRDRRVSLEGMSCLAATDALSEANARADEGVSASAFGDLLGR